MADYPERFPECHCLENARRMAELHPELAVVEGFLVFRRPDPFEPFRRPFTYEPSEGPGGRAR